MIDLNGDRLNIDVCPLPGGSYVGSFTLNGINVELEKTPPTKSAYSSTPLMRGLRKIIINGQHRGYLVLPHGWGKNPTIRKIRNGTGEPSYDDITSLYGKAKDNVYTLKSHIEKIVNAFQKGELETAEEIAQKVARDKEDRARREQDYEDARNKARSERIIHGAGLRSILEEKMNLTQEQKDALDWAIRQLG